MASFNFSSCKTLSGTFNTHRKPLRTGIAIDITGCCQNQLVKALILAHAPTIWSKSKLVYYLLPESPLARCRGYHCAWYWCFADLRGFQSTAKSLGLSIRIDTRVGHLQQENAEIFLIFLSRCARYKSAYKLFLPPQIARSLLPWTRFEKIRVIPTQP